MDAIRVAKFAPGGSCGFYALTEMAFFQPICGGLKPLILCWGPLRRVDQKLLRDRT